MFKGHKKMAVAGYPGQPFSVFTQFGTYYLLQIEAIEIHHFGPRMNEVADELVM